MHIFEMSTDSFSKFAYNHARGTQDFNTHEIVRFLSNRDREPKRMRKICRMREKKIVACIPRSHQHENSIGRGREAAD